ncbi:MAG: tetratricopeptide repeat protein [Desulfovibrionaceae bacterium]
MSDTHDEGPHGQTAIKGVFSRDVTLKIGAGTTTRKVTQTNHYYIEEDDAGGLTAQMLNNSFIPFGPKETVSREDVLENYKPELEIYAKKMLPAMREVQKTLARADRHRQQKDYFSAEYEYKNALKLEDTNVRATFGLGLSYMERGDKEKADDIFKRLIALDDAFTPENKHLFNEFGINLRKQEMYEQALKYYAKALKTGPMDPHLLYNVARIYHAQDNLLKAGAFLKKAVEIKPDFEEGATFLRHVALELKKRQAKPS